MKKSRRGQRTSGKSSAKNSSSAKVELYPMLTKKAPIVERSVNLLVSLTSNGSGIIN
jgi:hypothetical protein